MEEFSLKWYIESANRTLAPLPQLMEDERVPETLNCVHMVLGMGTELIELEEAIEKEDSINIGEEIADIWWYIANYLTQRIPTILGVSLPLIASQSQLRHWEKNILDPRLHVYLDNVEGHTAMFHTIPRPFPIVARTAPIPVKDYMKYLRKYVLLLQDLWKKHLAYGKTLKRDSSYVELYYLNNIMAMLSNMTLAYGVDHRQILINNIDKLKARYADKFSSDEAINRDLTKERKELEK